MRASLLVAVVLFLSACTSQKLETPLEKLEPFVIYPEASVYRLLSAPRELDGVRIRTNGVVEFFHDGSGAFLYASRHDAQESLPLTRIQLHFSPAISTKDWFQHFLKEKVRFSGWIVGVYHTGEEPDYLIRLDDVSEFDVKSDE